MNKKELLKECTRIISTPKIDKWHRDNLEAKNQGNILFMLHKAVKNNELELGEALMLSFVAGMQFSIEFKDKVKG